MLPQYYFKIAIKRLLCAIVFLLVSSGISAQERKGERLLFIGNSFTFFWNTPQLVQAIAINQGVPLVTAQSTVGGSNLKQHWEAEKNTITRKRLEEETWDMIVLQDHSTSTISHTERFHEYGKKFIDLVAERGAEPILFLTWAYASNPLMQEKITKEYLSLAKSTGTKVIPAGMVWEQVRELRPDLNMFFDDKHPSADATYLNALLIYKTITGKSVADVPDRLFTITDDGEKQYLCFVLPETGKFFRDLVEKMNVEEFNYSNNER